MREEQSQAWYLVQAAGLFIAYLEETQSAITQMILSKPKSVLSKIRTRNVKLSKAPVILLLLTCVMTHLIRAVYFILFIVVAFAIFIYSSWQVQGDPH